MYFYAWCWSARMTKTCSIIDTSNKQVFCLTVIYLVTLKSYCNALEIIRLSASIFTTSKLSWITLYTFQGMYTGWQHASTSQHKCTIEKIKTCTMQLKMHRQFMHHEELYRVRICTKIFYIVQSACIKWKPTYN